MARSRPDYLCIRIQIASNHNMDRRRYNRPTISQVGALIVDSDQPTLGRDIIIESCQGGLKRISELNHAYDPLQYPLLHPHGETGWTTGIPHRSVIFNNTQI